MLPLPANRVRPYAARQLSSLGVGPARSRPRPHLLGTPATHREMTASGRAAKFLVRARRGDRYRQQKNGVEFFSIRIMGQEYTVSSDTLARLGLPLGGFVLLPLAVSVVLGPLVIAMAAAALGIGAALAAGAMATAMVLPIVLAVGLGSLYFVGLTFGTIATVGGVGLGVASLIGKVLSLGIGLGGLGLGFVAANFILAQQPKPEVLEVDVQELQDDGTVKPDKQAVREAQDRARELLEFDKVLERRAKERAREERR